MIDTIARVGVVLLALTCAATADPILVDERGWACGLEFSGPEEETVVKPLDRRVRVRLGYAILVDVQAGHENRTDETGAWEIPLGLDPAFPLPFDLGGTDPGATTFDPTNDTVDFTPNPEPGSLLLAGAGLMALYLLRRRRQHG